MVVSIVEEGADGANEIQLHNTNSDYPTARISNDPKQDLSDINWINYFMCGYKSVMIHNEEFRSHLTGPPKGLKILIDSRVPVAAGLSSSSAMTVCSSIMASHANGIRENIDRQLQALQVANSERMAGTMIGDMDQTASIMCNKGEVLLIDFNPKLKATPLPIPKDMRLVVSNTCVPQPKLAFLGTRYNKRVLECQFGVAACALKVGAIQKWEECNPKFMTYEKLMTHLGYNLEQMLELAEEAFPIKTEMSWQQIKDTWNVEDPLVIAHYIKDWEKVLSENTGLELYRRSQFIFTETQRTHEIHRLCMDNTISEDEKCKQIGK